MEKIQRFKQFNESLQKDLNLDDEAFARFKREYPKLRKKAAP